MAGSSMGLHEATEDLKPETIDRHRALVSLMEELEAMDWYQQRIDAARDPGLAAILTHNRDEETEHAAMSLEWLRRADPVLDRHLRRYLFTSGPITEIEREEEGREGDDAGASRPAGDGSLGLGSLKGASR